MNEQAAYPAPRPRSGSALFWVFLIGWLAFLGLVAGAVAGLAAVYRSDQILAGVTALGRDLSGKTASEAAAVLAAEWVSRSVILENGEQRWALAPEQVGVLLDAEGTARAALAQGRHQPTADRLAALAERLIATSGIVPLEVAPIAVKPQWRFDRERATATLRILAGQIDIPKQDAGLQVVDGRIETTPAVVGRALDIAAVLARLEAHPWEEALADPTVEPPRFELPVVPQEPAISDVSAVVAELEPLLASPITLRLYDPIRDERLTWTAEPAALGKWLSFAVVRAESGERRLVWSVDEEAVAAFVREQNTSFGDERFVDVRTAVPILAEAFKSRQAEVRLRIYHGERQHVVQAGETLSSIAFKYGMPYPWIQAANPGTGDALFVGDRLRIPSPDVFLPLPVVENKRIIVSLSKQRVQVYENGQLKWDWPASTGIASSPTSPGVFQIQSHEEMAYASIWNLYMPWFMGVYRVAPGQDFMNGFHGFPSRDRRQFIWERNLGSPITYGCILISTENAKKLYDWAEKGVVVEIRP